MLYFASDYMEGAHPEIIRRLTETNLEKTSGYGTDPYCRMAKEKIRNCCDCQEAEVFFLTGGTQTNATVIDALLASYQGVISADSGHINVHEAGAVEASGHKVLTLPQEGGKINPRVLEQYLRTFYEDENREHMVEPGMVYISHPTELGTLYTKEELSQLSEICRRYHQYLYADGARLGYGLAAGGTDVTLKTLAEYCDVFYIGGTKVGALLGEAVVIPNPDTIKRFFTIVKQHGALLAKGRLLGLQFDTLFTDDLYLKISRHAVEMAQKMQTAFINAGYSLYIKSPTNQIFVIIDHNTKMKLEEQVLFSFWEHYDDEHVILRFASSWATKEEDVEALIKLL